MFNRKPTILFAWQYNAIAVDGILSPGDLPQGIKRWREDS